MKSTTSSNDEFSKENQNCDFGSFFDPNYTEIDNCSRIL